MMRWVLTLFCLVSWGVASVEASNNAAIDVGGSSVPGSMTAGSTASVRIRVRNTGTTTWSPGALYRLGANPGNRVTWKGFSCGGYMRSLTDARVYLCGNVGPGGTYDFNFQITAPSSPGTYRLEVRMVRDGVQWFGQSHSFTISVTGTSSTNDAAIDVGGSSVPGSMTAGSTASVRIRVRNTGTTTWSPGALYRLGANPGNRVTWKGFPCGGYMHGLTNARVFLCRNVGPGGAYDFNFQITAPSSPGTYRFEVRMVRDGVQWFGQSYSWNITVTGGGGGVCPPGQLDIGDYVLGDSPNMRVYVKNTRGQTETFAYRPGVFVGGLNQHFFIKNDGGDNWEEFGLDRNFVYRWRDTSWTDRCTNPDAEAYYEVVDNNRSSFAKWAPRCMRVGQSWTSDVGSQVKAHFEQINNCAECTSQYEGPTRQRTTLVKHHPVYRTIWGVDIPDVIELYGASTTDRFFYSKRYGLVGFEGPDPSGGQFVMGAERISESGHNPPHRVPLCGNDTPPGFTGLKGFGTLVGYCFDERRVAVQGIVPNDVRPGFLDGRLQGSARPVTDTFGKKPGAVGLDGVSGNVRIDDSQSLSDRRGIQVEALVYRQSNNSEDGVVGRWYGGDQWLLTFYPEGAGKLVFTVRLEDGSYQSVSYRLPNRRYLRTWVHVAASYHANRGLRLYWNGGRVAATKRSGKRLAATSKPIRIGDSGNRWSRFHGRIDGVKISTPKISTPKSKRRLSPISPKLLRHTDKKVEKGRVRK